MSTTMPPAPTSIFLTALPLTKSLPVLGSISARKRDWTSASVMAIGCSVGNGSRCRKDFDISEKRPLSIFAARGAFARIFVSPPERKVFPRCPRPPPPARPPAPLRHDGAAVRERPLPHRPHHGVHPGRHLGALPADAGPRGAFRLRRRRARRGDHAEGRRRRASRRRRWSRRSPRRARSTSRASTSASTTGTRRTRRRTSSCRRTSTGACATACPRSSRRSRSSNSTTR